MESRLERGDIFICFSSDVSPSIVLSSERIWEGMVELSLPHRQTKWVVICGAADRSGRSKRRSSSCCCWGTIIDLTKYSFLGCEKAKTLSQKGCEKAKTLSQKRCVEAKTLSQKGCVKAKTLF